MTDVTLRFTVATRTITDNHKRYSGQVNDSISTTLHFEYDPITFLSDGQYEPYIQFGVYDDDGNALTYGKNSTPVFDGYTFTIPWDVTSRVKSQRVEFQLFFVKNNVVFNGNVAQLDSTEYILSAIYGVTLKPSIQCKPQKKGCCPPMNPTTEPSVVGYINLWKEYGMVVPVEQRIDPASNRMTLVFHTYNGTQDQVLTLDVPYVGPDGKIPPEFLNLITTIPDDIPTEQYQIPTAKAVFDWITREYANRSIGVAQWEQDRAYQFGSVVADGADLYISLSDGNTGNEPTPNSQYWTLVMEYDAIVTQWTDPTNDVTIPSQKLVKDSLDAKLDDSQLVTGWTDPVSDENIPSEKLVKDSLDAKLDDAQVVTQWTDPTSDENIPSEKLVKASLDDKLDDSQIINDWADATTDNIPNSVLVKDSLDGKLDDAQVVTAWSDPVSDANIPSEKLVKDSLDDKTDYRMAIRHWYPEAMYGNDSVVMYAGTIYISRADENKGHVPTDTESRVWWAKVEGTGGDSEPRIYTDIIGNGEDRTYVVRHGLGTTDIFYTMRFNDSYRQFTDADVYILNDNEIEIITFAPLPMDSLVVTICAGQNPLVYKEVIGNGTDAQFDITHNLGSLNVFVTVRENATGRFVRTTIEATSEDTVRVTFRTPPTQDEYTVTIAQMMQGKDNDTFVHRQDVASEVWIVGHSLSRLTVVQVFGDDGQDIVGVVKHNITDPNTTTIEFNHPQMGYAVFK